MTLENPTETELIESEFAESAGADHAQQLQIISEISSGGMSIIYKARHKHIGTDLAVKVLHAHLANDPIAVQRLAQEAKILSSLNHPNIVKVRSFGLTNSNRPYLVMEYLEGRTLAQVIREEGPLEPERAREVLLQICEGLLYAHSRDVLHRDLKPSNVILCSERDGTEIAKLIDFGIAKIASESGQAQQQLTKTGVVIGSLPYMSPETWQGKICDQRSDVYSFGCLMFEVLTGKQAFDDETTFQIMQSHMEGTIPRLNEYLKSSALVTHLDKVLQKTLQKAPEQRFQSISALYDALNNDDFTTRSRKYRVRKRRANKKAILIACLSVFFGVILMAVLTYFRLRPNPPEPVHSVERLGNVDSIIRDAYVLVIADQPQEALRILADGRKTATRLGRKIEMAQIETAMGKAYQKLGQEREALASFQRASRLIKDVHLEESVYGIQAEQELFNAYAAVHDWKNMDKHFDEAIKLADKVFEGPNELKAAIETWYANIAMDRRMYQESIDHAENALKLYLACPNNDSNPILGEHAMLLRAWAFKHGSLNPRYLKPLLDAEPEDGQSYLFRSASEAPNSLKDYKTENKLLVKALKACRFMISRYKLRNETVLRRSDKEEYSSVLNALIKNYEVMGDAPQAARFKKIAEDAAADKI